MSLFEYEAPVVGLREQKKHQTRLDLCRAARRSVLERGLDATTVEDVAKAVGVSPRTFFNYYETKLDAVVGPVGEIGTPSARAQFTAGGPTGSLIEDLAQLYAAGFDAEVLEDISQVSEIVRTEPRVLAGLVAAGAKHESAVAELLGARVGDVLAPEFASLTAALMSTLTMRAAMAVGQHPDRPLTAALHDYCAMAARLFAPTPAHETTDHRRRG
ncbi:TetR/AcrR family transcriptional regulator [Nocardia jiangxiensis]|uniref:TetR/AcrR family transcriptional regulator n=1 Tax=Nocardia jiangxiensis TaxID=282685 RepID=A0ABW6SDF3_9NOCA|nr:TetR/AcrR family transcriptional regulator [Nocardia jiangxiensis]